MSAFQNAYNKYNEENKKPAKGKQRSSTLSGKELTFYAAVNGAGTGLKEVEERLKVIDRIVAKHYGLHISSPQVRQLTLAAIAFIGDNQLFRTKKTKNAVTEWPPKVASKVDMRDYSGFSRQCHSKEWYKTKPKDRSIPPTPRTRQRPQTKPIKKTPATHGTTVVFRRQPVTV